MRIRRARRLGGMYLPVHLLVIIGAVFLSLAGAQEETLEVFASMPPQAYFAERVAGEHIAVHILVQPGQEPHTFEPTPKQIRALSRARLFLKAGMLFESQLVEKIQGTHQRLIIVDTAKGIKKRTMAAHHHRKAEHRTQRKEKAPKEQHVYRAHSEAQREVLDPHIWLSPPLIKIQAKNIADALKEADPAHAEDYQKNLATFWQDLDETHAKIQDMLAPYEGQSFYVFHPAFGYFADAYGLKQEAVEAEGKAPTPKQLSELIEKAKAGNVKIVFVQPQFDRKSAKAIAQAIGGAVVPMDPLEKDVLRNLEDMATKLKYYYGTSTRPSR